MNPLLSVKNLHVEFDTLRGRLQALRGVSFDVLPGETLGIVGESGCGKSITSLSLMGLLPPNAHVKSDGLIFQGRDLLKLKESEKRKIRGAEISMIFQDPMSSLNPSFPVGRQIEEVIEEHEPLVSKTDRTKRVLELLEQVGIPKAKDRIRAFPHELSGGMCQRVMIAMAIASKPKLLIADEPTTALDVTIQAQILNLLRDLQKEYQMALMLITHDLAVVSEMSKNILVMYAGEIVEEGLTKEVIQNPIHPYTKGLLHCLPSSHEGSEGRKLPSIRGLVPDLVARPSGCQFHPRCDFVKPECSSGLVRLRELQQGRKSRCFFS